MTNSLFLSFAIVILHFHSCSFSVLNDPVNPSLFMTSPWPFRIPYIYELLLIILIIINIYFNHYTLGLKHLININHSMTWLIYPLLCLFYLDNMHPAQPGSMTLLERISSQLVLLSRWNINLILIIIKINTCTSTLFQRI